MFGGLTAGRSRLFEQLFGGRAVGLNPLHVRFDPRDLGLECLDPVLELIDRHGIEVLLREGNQRVVRLAWEELVEVHC
jgi:hypothetical protein